MKTRIEEISPKQIIIYVKDNSFSFYFKEINPDTIHITFVVAGKSHTGLGYFAFKDFEDYMRKKGYKKITLTPDNKKLQRLYEKYGFTAEDPQALSYMYKEL